MRDRTLWHGAILVLIAANLRAQSGPRIARPIDERRLIRLPGTTHPLTRRARDLGGVPANLSIDRILLQLSSSPEQQAELDHLLTDLYDPASPQFHQWLTPEQFGERFGPAPADVDAVAQWLTIQGFRVDG